MPSLSIHLEGSGEKLVFGPEVGYHLFLRSDEPPIHGPFCQQSAPRKGLESLINIKQREGESIRAYINRFNVAVLEVRNLHQSVAMVALKGGLQKNDLLFSLEKKYPRDFANLLARAEGYARAEEAFKMKDEETARERQAGDSSRPAIKKGLREARPCSRTPPGCKRIQTPP